MLNSKEIREENWNYLWSVFQVMTQADLGIADAYINGDFSFVDKDEGLLHFILVAALCWPQT